MRVKRWLLLLAAGVALMALGLAALFEVLEGAAFARSVVAARPASWSSGLLIALLMVSGAAISTAAIVAFNRSLLSAFRRVGQGEVVDVVYNYRQRRRGPKIVAIGGGHGLSTLLRGLKEYTDNITAILTVADDGGSSGRLRRDFGMLPPGDFRNCIAALSDAEGLLGHLFQYRFGEDTGLEGHSFGNLYITAMAAITGSFESALSESSHVLAVRGRVIPSTLAMVNLCADVWLPAREVAPGREPAAQPGSPQAAPIAEGTVASVTPMDGRRRGARAGAQGGRWTNVCGESKIPALDGRIQRVYLDPEDPPVYPEAIRAILEADLIVAGPGSLYTSVLPNLLVRDLAHAIRASSGTKVYVCNVATQPGETTGFDVTAHLEALNDHVGPGLFDVVLANSTFRLDRPPGGGADFVRLPPPGEPMEYELVAKDLVDSEYPWRHDPVKLARAVISFVNF